MENGTNVARKIGKNDSFIYSNEIRYFSNGEKIQKKKQITAREYIELLENKDTSRRQIRKIRQCFIYERQYFMVECFTNVDGNPSILRIESTGEAQKIQIPPILQVLREVTNEEFYETRFMADLNYEMPTSDKMQIKHMIAKDNAKANAAEN